MVPKYSSITIRSCLLLFVMFLGVSPLIIPQFYLLILTDALIIGLLAISLDLIMGYAGMVSFGHAAFFGVGAYISAWIITWQPVSFPLILLIAFVVNGLFGWGVGLVAKKARGIYFAMITLGLSEVLHWTLYDLKKISGGDTGIVGISPSPIYIPGFLNLDITPPWIYFYVTAVVVGFSLWVAYRLTSSPFGSILKGIRENEDRCQFVGYSVNKYKLIAIVFSTGFAGVAGALYAPLYGFASPHMMEFHFSGKIIFMVLMGGMGTLIGPFWGGIFLTILESIIGSYIKDYLMFIGLTFILFVIFLPDGLYGLFTKVLRRD